MLAVIGENSTAIGSMPVSYSPSTGMNPMMMRDCVQ